MSATTTERKTAAETKAEREQAMNAYYEEGMAWTEADAVDAVDALTPRQRMALDLTLGYSYSMSARSIAVIEDEVSYLVDRRLVMISDGFPLIPQGMQFCAGRVSGWVNEGPGIPCTIEVPDPVFDAMNGHQWGSESKKAPQGLSTSDLLVKVANVQSDPDFPVESVLDQHFRGRMASQGLRTDLWRPINRKFKYGSLRDEIRGWTVTVPTPGSAVEAKQMREGVLAAAQGALTESDAVRSGWVQIGAITCEWASERAGVRTAP